MQILEMPDEAAKSIAERGCWISEAHTAARIARLRLAVVWPLAKLGFPWWGKRVANDQRDIISERRYAIEEFASNWKLKTRGTRMSGSAWRD